ncbi:MAG TPA: class I SAM-dependent methyltransferase [Pseudonocardiaceae bacterium]|nr:class I SAM-dependent methyltransferase [Pseudonocardiaceae bacterium]
MASGAWTSGDAYDAYIGRWSRPVAAAFVARLAVPAGRRWLDVGCGTGALTAAVLATADPARVLGVDPSTAFLATARTRLTDQRVTLATADAQSLPDGPFDAVVSGLALNFVPDPGGAVTEFARVCRPGGVVAAYVWDYTSGMAMLRYFWDAVATLDPARAELDEGRRFSLCQPEALRTLWTDGGLHDVAVEPIDVPTVFTGFHDYWRPFLGGQGPAAGYVMSLTEDRRRDLRDLIRLRLPDTEDGSIPLTARAWAVRGTA